MSIQVKQIRNTGIWQGIHRFLSIFFLISIIITLNACGESSKDGNEEDTSILSIGLTDAPAGFSTYTVDVLSLTLTTANGAVVETMPISTRVDFAQYADMTEFLTAATVPSARYVKASMTLDYQNAEIWLASSNGGNGVKLEDFRDIDGNPITTVEVAVHLENRNSLRIRPGVPAYLSLDFNLDASNTLVMPGMGEPTLVVKPFLIAELDPERPKIHRVRGPLLKVDQSNNRIQIAIHPFHHRLNVDNRRFGHLGVAVGESTIYEIDGMPYQGDDGLAVLADMPAFTATIAIGDYSPKLNRFVAREVYAGSSVPGGSKDVVRGNIIKRDNDVLTVQGATLIRSDGTIIFNDTVLVNVSGDTVVRRLLSMDQHDIGELSVGQKIAVFGDIQPQITGEPMVVDATTNEDRVRMGMTVLRGFAADVSSNLIAELQSIDFRSIDRFDFTGTGVDTANDADPDNYEIETGTLDINDISSGAPIAVGGFVSAFGMAPMDFNANTIVDLSNTPGVMAINWDPATLSPFQSLASDGIIIDLSGVDVFHHIGRGGVRVDLLDLELPPTITPVIDEPGVYVVQRSGSVELHTDFGLFVQRLEALLGDASTIRSVTALGRYTDDTAVMVAESIVVKVE